MPLLGCIFPLCSNEAVHENPSLVINCEKSQSAETVEWPIGPCLIYPTRLPLVLFAHWAKYIEGTCGGIANLDAMFHTAGDNKDLASFDYSRFVTDGKF